MTSAFSFSHLHSTFFPRSAYVPRCGLFNKYCLFPIAELLSFFFHRSMHYNRWIPNSSWSSLYFWTITGRIQRQLYVPRKGNFTSFRLNFSIIFSLFQCFSNLFCTKQTWNNLPDFFFSCFAISSFCPSSVSLVADSFSFSSPCQPLTFNPEIFSILPLEIRS